MPYTKNRQNTPLSEMNIAEYVANKGKRDRATFVFSPTKSYYVLDGFVYEKETFEKAFPLKLKRHNPKGENPDKRHQYLIP